MSKQSLKQINSIQHLINLECLHTKKKMKSDILEQCV